MSETAQLFDAPLVRARLARAHRIGFASFLVDHAADELRGRLASVLRDFPLALDLASPVAVLGGDREGLERVGRVVRLGLGSKPAHPLDIVGDPAALPFREQPSAFDLAVSLLALSQTNDLPGTLIQVRRLLKPDGLFLGCLFGGATLSELRRAFWQAESEIEGGVSPRVAPFAEVRDLGALLQRAGFALPVADSETLTVRYSDPFALMRDLRAMGLTNALTERRRSFLRRATLMRAVEIYADRYADPDGRVRATFEFVWLSGWAPHEGQQKPLRPGSAKTRLADALGTREERIVGQ